LVGRTDFRRDEEGKDKGMIRDFFNKIGRHAAVACGNFERIFENTESLSPLPTQTMQLLREVNSESPDFDRIDTMLTSTPEIAAYILRMVNSAASGVPHEIKNVRHAMAMLGLRRIKQLITSASVVTSLPQPSSTLFDRQKFWTDSLVTALLARSLTRHTFAEYEEEVFISTLLSEMAIPVLLVDWEEYYAPVLREWQEDTRRLWNIEQAYFGWDHSQAAVWLAQQWGFPEEMVSLIGTHTLSVDLLTGHDLDRTPAASIALAAGFPSMLKNVKLSLVDSAMNVAYILGIPASELATDVTRIEEQYEDMREMLGLPKQGTDQRFRELREAFEEAGERGL